MLKPKNINDEIILSVYKISRGIRKLTRQDSHHEELNALQLQAMIDISSEKKITMGNLSKKLYVSLPTATVFIDKLVKSGFVDRKFDFRDRRVIMLELTPAGKKILKKTLALKFKKMNALLKNISDEDKITLKRILSDVLEALDKKQNIS